VTATSFASFASAAHRAAGAALVRVVAFG